MPKLKNEYIDVKNIKHTVNHLTLSNDDRSLQEQIIGELRDVFTKQTKKSTENTL